MLELEKLLKRQVAYAARQSGERLLLALPRVVRFVSDEPRLRAIIDDIDHEYEAAVEAFHAIDRHAAQEILQLWNTDAEWLLAAWNRKLAAAGAAAHWAEIYGSPEKLPSLLERAGQAELRRFKELDERGAVAEAFVAIRHWTACVQHSEGVEAQLQAFDERLSEVEVTHEAALRTFLAVARSHAGASWRRLQDCAGSFTMPPSLDTGAYLTSLPQLRIANAALGLGRHDHEKATPESYREQILTDLDIVSEEVRHRLGLHLSNWALVNRFKTRCQRFEAQHLRAAASKKPRKAEEVLTMAAAAYLFDCGLNPLVNTQIATLRPDLFDPTTPFSLYVEAKQYDSDAPRQKIIAAAWQVWDTWNELEEPYQVREAFLLIFRRAGPLLVFDGPPPHLNGRALHPVLIDIAEATEKGSRARSEPIHIAPSELLPRPAM